MSMSLQRNFWGILYITNKRGGVQCKDNGFDKMHRYLTSVKPYTNGVELQYGNKTYNLVVPDGALVAYAIKLANQCIILTEYM